MKRISLLLCVLLLCGFGLRAEAKGKTLVAYYSYTGNCRQIVGSLTGQIAADVAEITTVAQNQDYNANNYQLGRDLLNAINADPDNINAYPPINDIALDVSNYDNVILVVPLWHAQMAAPAQTWLFKNRDKLAGRHFGMIVSSHSSGISTVVANANRLVPQAEWMGEALWINRNNHSNRSTLIADWLNTLTFAESQQPMTDKLYITIDGGKTLTATLADNSSARALVEALRNAPIVYQANDFGNFEKVGPLGQSFPTNDEPIVTEPGDVILYQGSNLCLYYDTNSWTFTRIGKIEGLTQDELRQALKAGQGAITVKLSLTETATLINNVFTNHNDDANAYYTLDGRRVASPTSGIYINSKGEKIVINR